MADIIQINDNTWRIEDGMVRFFLLAGTKEALLIDSGMTTSNAKEIAESITSLPIRHLITHADRDHISGSSAFDAVLMSPNEEVLYRKHYSTGTIEAVQQSDIIDLGDRPLEIIDLPGHTYGSIAVLDINNRVLISGDSIQDGRIYMFGEHRNLPNYIAGLTALSQYKDRFDTIYPSHSTFPVSPDLIPKLIKGAEQILSGQADGKEIDLFGNAVMLYQFEYAGFLCPVKN